MNLVEKSITSKTLYGIPYEGIEKVAIKEARKKGENLRNKEGERKGKKKEKDRREEKS